MAMDKCIGLVSNGSEAAGDGQCFVMVYGNDHMHSICPLHTCMYIYVCAPHAWLASVRGHHGLGPSPFFIALALPFKSGDCHGSRLLCAASAPKVARARAKLSLDAEQIILAIVQLIQQWTCLTCSTRVG